MCKIEDCERHEFDKGVCLVHLRETYAVEVPSVPVEETEKEKPTRRSRKKIDALELLTADSPVDEERIETE